MVIQLENLVVSYALGSETLEILNIPSWNIETEIQLAISGTSGSGKSTLLHVLAGLLVPTRGIVRVCECELTGLGEAQRDAFRGRSISIIFQNFNLLQGYTALENVLMGMAFAAVKQETANARQALERLGLGRRIRHYPAQLSIGEQQRVAIARALVKKPALILADEPTGSLDPKHTDEVIRSLKEACREYGCSLIVVSHEERVVKSFEHHVSIMELNRAMA